MSRTPHDSEMSLAFMIKFPTPNTTSLADPSSIEPYLTPGESLSGSGKLSHSNWSRTKRARDDTLQDDARTTAHALFIFLIDSHNTTLSCPPLPQSRRRPTLDTVLLLPARRTWYKSPPIATELLSTDNN